MTCVEAQYGTLPYENNYYISEFLSTDITAKLAMDISGQQDQPSTPSLPSINSLVGSYAGEFDAYPCQISSPVASTNVTASQPSPFKMDDFQVYGCYPGTFSLSYLDETHSSCGSDYYGSPASAPSPSTPSFQAQPVTAWDSPFSSYSPGAACWVPDKTSLTQPPSFFTFSPPVEQPSPAGQQQPSLTDREPFSHPQLHSSALPFAPMGPGSLDGSALMEEPVSPKVRSPTGNEGRCAVCGDSASCQHYGVRTCEGCKGFFKVRSLT